MGPGGASALAATGTPDAPIASIQDRGIRLRQGAPLSVNIIVRGSRLEGIIRLRVRAPNTTSVLVHETRFSVRRSPVGSWIIPRLRRDRTREERTLPLARAAPASRSSRTVRPTDVHNENARPRPLGRLGSGRLPAFHLPPINPVVCRGSYLLNSGEARLGEGFPLRCFQRFARPNVATQRCRLPDNWPTSGSSSPVLSY